VFPGGQDTHRSTPESTDLCSGPILIRERERECEQGRERRRGREGAGERRDEGSHSPIVICDSTDEEEDAVEADVGHAVPQSACQIPRKIPRKIPRVEDSRRKKARFTMNAQEGSCSSLPCARDPGNDNVHAAPPSPALHERDRQSEAQREKETATLLSEPPPPPPPPPPTFSLIQ